MSLGGFGGGGVDLRELERALRELVTVVNKNAQFSNEMGSRIATLESLAQTLSNSGGAGIDPAAGRMAAARDLIGSGAEHAKKYLTAIIFGGYAAYFGFWSFLHGKVNEIVDGLSGLCMLVSMGVFFGYEISKAIRNTWYLADQYLKIPQDADAVTVSDALIEIHKRGRAFDENMIRLTKKQTILSVIPAAIAILLLATAFGSHLVILMRPTILAIWSSIF